MKKFYIYECPKCKRRRRVYPNGDDGVFYSWRCSQGHEWKTKIPFIDQAENLLREIYAPVLASMLDPSPLVEIRKGS